MKHLGRLLTVVVLATIPSCTAGNDAVGLSVEELTYDQLVQGESATGAGSTVIDGSANGGAFHRNTVLLTTATASFNTTGSIMSGIVRARRGSGSCTPGLQISVDGVGQLVTLSGGNTWTDYPFSVSRPAGSHTLSLYYRTGVSGCALDVDVVTFSVYEPTPPPTNTVTLEAESATGAGTNALDGVASGGAYRGFTASSTGASIPFTTTGPLTSATVRVRAGAACSPRAQIFIDGVVAFGPQAISSSSWTTINLSASLAAGNHTLQFYAYTASVACPLHYDVATLITSVPPPPPITTIVEAELASGSGAIENDINASGGQARFFTVPYISATSSITTTAAYGSATVRVRGGSCTPWGSIRIDGIDTWTGPVPQAGWTTVNLATSPLAAGPHTIEFYSRWATASCAMHFDQVTLAP